MSTNTKEQLSALKEKYNELGKEIQKLKEKEKVDSFLTEGDVYYYVSSIGEVDYTWYRNDHIDEKLQAIGNFYQFKEQAEAEIEYLKVVQELKNCKGSKKFIAGEENYYHMLSILHNRLDVNYGMFFPLAPMLTYFESYADCNDAIGKVGKERIIKAIKWKHLQEY